MYRVYKTLNQGVIVKNICDQRFKYTIFITKIKPVRQRRHGSDAWDFDCIFFKAAPLFGSSFYF